MEIEHGHWDISSMTGSGSPRYWWRECCSEWCAGEPARLRSRSSYICYPIWKVGS